MLMCSVPEALLDFSLLLISRKEEKSRKASGTRVMNLKPTVVALFSQVNPPAYSEGLVHRRASLSVLYTVRNTSNSDL